MIEDSLKNRKHVVYYDQDNYPAQNEIQEILETAYSLVTSKQKAYPYKVYILGLNQSRSEKLWNLCEGNKIDTDTKVNGDQGKRYRANPGLFHVKTAPWTLIITPRVAPPNPYNEKAFKDTKSHWELDNPNFVDYNNRESAAVEIGMLAKAITGASLDREWDTSYNICFLKNINQWTDFPYIKFYPTLIQTIGKGVKYKWETLSPQQSLDDTDPPFDDIFEFIDRK
tara:strand:+ start:1462 stop:2139 length:678 start_codon:yes stop_codon:yes gene_type:complete